MPLSQDPKRKRQLIQSRLTNRTLWGRQRVQFLKPYLLGSGLLMFGFGTYKYKQLLDLESDIAQKKKQLVRDVYELNEDEMTDLPWANQEGLEEWLYRPVKITGRPIHAKQMMIPRKVKGHAGYDCIVPFVTKENEDGSNQYGMLFNMGWIPHENKAIEDRLRLEYADVQTFIGYVTQNKELDRSMFQKGNNYTIRQSEFSQPLNEFNHIDLDYMTKRLNFVNQNQSKLALVEQIRIDNNTRLDENYTQHYDLDAGHYGEYPYVKNKVGALQGAHSSSELKNQRRQYYTTGVLAILTGLLI